MSKQNILLDLADFKTLITGKTVVKEDGVHIALQDIGFATMLKTIKDVIDRLVPPNNYKEEN